MPKNKSNPLKTLTTEHTPVKALLGCNEDKDDPGRQCQIAIITLTVAPLGTRGVWGSADLGCPIG
jgi:hypothetical protein